ncbi:MAG TPA: hypothetical protein PK622_10635 [Saprospiraceae bacterium]|nr:hypothetical protein [Saprospiraceae bacterium]
MKDTKIYDFLSQFSATELNRFHRYLESPYHNRNQWCKSLFSVLESHIRTEDESDLDKQLVYQKIFETEAFDDKRFRKLCSDLLDLGESYLALEIYQSNPLHQANYLLQAVHQRQLEKMYNSATNSVKNLSAKQFQRPASYYYYQYEIEKNLYKLQNLEVKRASKNSIQLINLSEIVNNLDYFYISEKLKYYCSLLSWNKIVSLDHKILFIDEIIQIAEKEEFKHIPPIAIYLKIYYTYIEFENEEHYYDLKKLITLNLDIFPIDEAKDIMDSVINYTIQKQNKGRTEYAQELFDLYKITLEKETIFINNEISPWSFKNIVTNSLRLKEFEWTANFIKEYSNKINANYRQNAINYNIATLNFHQKNYIKVIPLLQNVEYEEEYYGLDSKVQLLITYFELNEMEVLSAFLDSFKIYINRNKNIPSANKSRYSNLIAFTRKIIKHQDADNAQITKLKTEISQSTSVAKPWLLEKVDELLYN